MPVETVLHVRFGRILTPEEKKNFKKELKWIIRRDAMRNISPSIRFLKRFKRKTQDGTTR
jgi:hypothetical protein